MKKNLYYGMYLLIILAAFTGCKENDKLLAQQNDLDPEVQTALDIVNTFRKQVAPSDMARSISSSDLNIIDYQQEDVLLRRVGNNRSLSRSTAAEIETVKLYNIRFELNGKKGFAYSSPDPRVNRVLAYCENGSIEDTVYIKSMAMAIKGIAISCAKDLGEYYSNGEKLSRASNSPRVVGPFMTTEWSQDGPYNENCGGSGCSTTLNGKYPAGCVAIAVAQSIAFVGRINSQFDLAALKKEKNISKYSSLAPEVAEFVYQVAIGCKTNFDCSGSGSTLALANTYLLSLGYNQKMIDYYYKKESSIDLIGISGLFQRMPTCVGGNTDKGKGHAWVFCGISATEKNVNQVDKIYALYCNWGWGGTGNGWYDNSTWYTPVDQFTFEPLSDGAYYRNNEFIYFRYYRP